MQDTLDQLYRYINAIYRYKYLFVLTSLLVMTVVGLYSFTLPKKYQADTTVFIENNVIDELVRGIAVTPDIQDKVQVLQYAILSRDMVVKTLEEMNSEIFTKSEAAQQAYVSDLIQRTRLNVTRRNDRFNVSIIDKDPAFAQQFINTLVSLYVEENISSTREETYGANRFLQEQLETFKTKLETAEDKIIDFRKKKGIYFSVDEAATLNNIRQMASEVEDIELTQNTLLGRKEQLQQQLDNTAQTVDFVSQSGEGGSLQTMENRLNTLLLTYTDNYPEVIQLRAEIEAMKQALAASEQQQDESGTTRMTSMNPLYQELQGRVYEIDAELSSLRARKKNLQLNIAKREKQLQEVPEAQKELGILIQERDSYRSIYEDLLARMGQSEVSKQMEVSNKASTFRIVDPAVLPQIPVSPNLLRMFLLSIAAGLGCGIGLVVLLENLDNRPRNISTVEGLGYEILAVVPTIKDPALIRVQRKRDLLLFFFSGSYLVLFVGLFAYRIFLA